MPSMVPKTLFPIAFNLINTLGCQYGDIIDKYGAIW